MATLYAASNGTILRWLPTVDLEASYPTAPAGTISTLTFDATGNRPVITDLNLSTDPYRLNGTTLTKNGTTVTITVVSTDSRRQMIDDLVAMQATIQAATTVNNLKSSMQDLRRMLLTVVRTVTFPEE